MNIGLILTVIFTGTWKFMFTPALAMGLGFGFIESWILSCTGAIISSFIFYWSAEYFMIRTHKRRVSKAIKEGANYKRKKQITRTNKTIVRLKKSVGWYGISFFIPLFLSIPVGSIIVAKFYGKRKLTYPLILIGIFINGFIITSISYLFF